MAAVWSVAGVVLLTGWVISIRFSVRYRIRSVVYPDAGMGFTLMARSRGFAGGLRGGSIAPAHYLGASLPREQRHRVSLCLGELSPRYYRLLS